MQKIQKTQICQTLEHDVLQPTWSVLILCLIQNHWKAHQKRPIAWCSFVLGKFDQAEKYFRKVIDKEGNRNDFMNLGHVLWCQGNRKEAIENYRKSLEKSNRDLEWFSSVMQEDSIHLLKYEIKDLDVPLMIDYIRMSV